MSVALDLLTEYAGLGLTTAVIFIAVLYGWKFLGVASGAGSYLKTTLVVLLLLAIGQLLGVVDLAVHADRAAELFGEVVGVFGGIV